MAYMKNRAPLMFDLPTPVNMPPAMAGWGGPNRAGQLGDETLETLPIAPPPHEAITSQKARTRAALAWGVGVVGVVLFLYLDERKSRKAGY